MSESPVAGNSWISKVFSCETAMCVGLVQLVQSVEELYVLLGRDCLPGELGGLLQYEHDNWIHRCQVSAFSETLHQYC